MSTAQKMERETVTAEGFESIVQDGIAIYIESQGGDETTWRPVVEGYLWQHFDIREPLKDPEQTIERAKAEILADVASGTVPRTCASFSELHDYVDANGYGGAFERPFDNGDTDFWNAVQDAVDSWIKGGGLNA